MLVMAMASCRGVLQIPVPFRHSALRSHLKLAFSQACRPAGSVVMAIVLAFGVSCGSCEAVVETPSVLCTSNSASEEEPFDVPEVTNESLVETAWEAVNEFYLDARHHIWSPDSWMAEKEKALGKPLRNRQAAYSAIRAMLSTLNDPYTRFLTPTEFLQTSKYDITGIGLNIVEVPDENGQTQMRVLGIVLQSPAELAGIRQGDEILSVDGETVAGKSAFEVSTAIQSHKGGTPVILEAKHAGCEDVLRFSIYRQQEKIKSPVFYRFESEKNGLIRGYVRLKEFNALTRRDLVTALERLTSNGATSFVLDLRDNLGGLVQEGIEVAKLFLEDGETVVYTARRNGALNGIVAKGQPLITAPLTVLVNDRTASASEIVAAALHDNCRAVLVGSRTFGKGLIQSVYEFNDGSGLVLTVGKYVTPGHVDIDTNGLQPDFRKMPGPLEISHKLKACVRKNSTQT